MRFAVTRFTRDTNVTIKLMNNNTSALSTTNVQTVIQFQLNFATVFLDQAGNR